MARLGKRRGSFVASDHSGDERPTKAAKKADNKKAAPTSGQADVDADGNTFWELSNKRRVVVSKFSGKMFVNVREYYEDKSGEMKPGKKGIMLSVEQYQALAGLIPAINVELRKKGVVLEGDEEEEKDDDDQEDDDEDEDEAPAKSSKSATKPKKKQSKKANIEATSDEDDD